MAPWEEPTCRNDAVLIQAIHASFERAVDNVLQQQIEEACEQFRVRLREEAARQVVLVSRWFQVDAHKDRLVITIHFGDKPDADQTS
jgi:hypothetical protein